MHAKDLVITWGKLRTEIDVVRFGLLFQHLGIMYTLSTTANFLSANEDIVGVGVAFVIGVVHSVEWTH